MRLNHAFRFSIAIAIAVLILSLSPLASNQTPNQQQQRKYYAPLLRASNSEEAEIALANVGVTPATVTFKARGYDGALLEGNGIVNPVSLTLAGNNSRLLKAREIFGGGISSGWMEITSNSATVTGGVFLRDSSTPSFDGADFSIPGNRLIFPRVTTDTSAASRIAFVNTGGRVLDRLVVSLYENSGRFFAKKEFSLPAFGGYWGGISSLIPNLQSFDGYAVVESAGTAASLVGFQTYRQNSDMAAIAAFSESTRSRVGYAGQFGESAGHLSSLVLINQGTQSQAVSVTAALIPTIGNDKNPQLQRADRTLAAGERWEGRLDQIFSLSADRAVVGFVRYETQGNGVFGYLESKTVDGAKLTVSSTVPTGYSDLQFPFMASTPGLSGEMTLVNTEANSASVTLDAFSAQGFPLGSNTITLSANGRLAGPIADLIPGTAGHLGGRVHVTASSLILSTQLLVMNSSPGAIANVPVLGNTSNVQASGQVVSAGTGGTVVSDDSGASLYVPPRALTSDTPIVVRSLNSQVPTLNESNPRSSGERLVGLAEGTPSGTQFRIPARLRFRLTEKFLQAGTELSVYIINPTTGAYELSEFVATVDPSRMTATAEVTHFTKFAVMAGVQSVRITSVSPDSATVTTPITISGSGFGLTPEENKVVFSKPGGNAVQAEVLKATSTRLTVVVPSGATSGKVYVQVGSVKSNSVVFKVISLTNQAPAVDAGPDQTVTLPEGVVMAGIVLDDGLPSGGSVTTTWSQVGGPGLATFANPSALNTPASVSAAGTYTFRLTANDTAKTASNDVVVDVLAAPPPNQAPVVNAGNDQTITLPAAVNLSGTATDDGLPVGELNAAWSKIAGPGTVTFGDSGAFTTSATFSIAGAYTLRLTAGDTALTAADDVSITVNAAPPNQAPLVSAGPDQTTAVTSNLRLSGTVTDDNLPGGPVSTTWTKVSGPGTVAFGDARVAITTASFSTSGTYVIRLTANDGLLSASDDATIQVTQNWQPVTSDTESMSVMAGALAVDGQTWWFYYDQSDAPEGAYMGWLNQAQSLSATIKLPRQLNPGRYYVFIYGCSYDYNQGLQVSVGPSVSTTVIADDRDLSGYWSERAIIDVTTSSTTLQLTVKRNPAIASDQKFLLRGLYITTNERESVDRYSTAIQLIYPSTMDNSAPIKGNLVTDGGFETGVDASWGFNSRRTDPPLWDNTTAYEGGGSMKVSLDHSANAYGDNMGVISRIYHLKPNRKYTVSLWVKTSPGKTVATAMTFNNAYTPPEGYPTQPQIGNFIYATDEWKRISATGYALDYPTPDYQIRLEANEVPGGFLWIDGVQIEEGDLTNYAPSSALIAGVYISGQPANIFYPDEPVTGTLIARNTSATPQNATMRYEIYDFLNQLVGQGGYDLSLPANTTQQAPINLNMGKQGIFRFVSWIDRMEYTTKEMVYAIIPRPPVSGLDTTSYLGIHPNYVDTQLNVLQKMGMKWARVLSPSGFFRWSIVEPIEGQIMWFDAEINRATTRGITTLGTIGTNNYWPTWADRGGVPDLAKWQTFVGKLAAHYKTSVQYWEIWNEPHSVFTADFYAQMLKGAVDAIEFNNPNAKIVGMGGVPHSYMQAVIAALQSRYPTWDWRQHIDVLSTHDYPDGEPPEAFRSVIDTHGLPVWNTETGSWDRGFYQGTNSNFSSWGKNLWPYADASRYYEGMVGSANSVVQNFLRTIASGQTNYFYYDSRAAASPEYLKGHTTMLEYDGTVRVKGVAYAIAGQLVDHSKGMGNVSPDPNTVMLMFDKPNSPIVALFSADKKPRQLTLSLASYQFQALDMMGNPIALNGTVIPYGRLPVYIRGVGISGSTLIGAMKGSLPSARADNTPPGVSISDAPTGTVRNNGFRVRWIAADDLSLPNLGEINPESNKASDAPNPDAIVYSYRLEGFVDWSPYTARTFVDFAQVPNGTYNFQVRAMDEAGNTSNIVSRAIVVNAQ